MFLVCGDYMEDLYIQADVERISPEAPVPVARVRGETSRPGGAANVLANVKALGMEARGLYSLSAATFPVRKLRILGRNQQMLRLDYDEFQKPIQPALFTPAPFIIFSDYDKGSLHEITSLIALAPASMIFVDPKGTDYSAYKGADFIKPNRDEMRAIVGPWASEHTLDGKAFNLVRDLNLKGLFLTRAEEGATLYTPTHKHHVPATRQEVFDVCGAGDTAISTFAVAVAKGFSLEEATHLATKAAGITCRHLGSYAPTYREVFCD